MGLVDAKNRPFLWQLIFTIKKSMTQLLISVKNIQETLQVLDAGVDIIDLKDPDVGALGALDLTITRQIVQQVNGRKLVSATVGEQHASIDALIADIHLRVEAGVDIVKVGMSDLFKHASFYDAIIQQTKAGAKIVVVFFADEVSDLSLLPALKVAGVYGAMLDTKNKHKNLLQAQHLQALHLFTQQCHQYQLKSGLAGSLQPQHIDLLMEINPTYIGFRGGVCKNSQRKSVISASRLREVVDLLRNRNKSTLKGSLS